MRLNTCTAARHGRSCPDLQVASVVCGGDREAREESDDQCSNSGVGGGEGAVAAPQEQEAQGHADHHVVAMEDRPAVGDGA